MSLSSTQGSVFVQARASTNSFQVKTRSGNDLNCVKAATPASITQVPSQQSSTVCTASIPSVVNYYDTNRDTKVTIAEFRDTLQAKIGRYCTPSGPPALMSGYAKGVDCNGIVQSIFPSVTDSPNYKTYGSLDGTAFYSALLAINDTALVPFCSSTTGISVPAAAHTVPVSLSSAHGETYFAAGPGGGTGVVSNASLWTPQTTNNARLSLTEASAKALTWYRDEYGKRNTDELSDEVMVILHVKATPSVPGGTYVFATQEASLLMPPPFLAAIGANALNPTLGKETIHLTSNLCEGATHYNASTYYEWDVTSVDYQERLAQIHYQLTRALTPPAQSGLRGSLVRMEEDDHLTYAYYQVLTPGVTIDGDGVVSFPDDASQAEEEFPGRYAEMATVMSLSCAIALLLTVLVALLAFRHFARKLKTRYDRLEVDFKIGVRGVPAPDNVTRSRFFVPFEVPVELFQLIVPYRSTFFNSVSRFLSVHTTSFDRKYESVIGQKIAEDPRKQRSLWDKMSNRNQVKPAEAHKRSATFTTTLSLEQVVGDGMRVGLMQSRYQAYCFAEQLKMEPDMNRLIKHLKYVILWPLIPVVRVEHAVQYVCNMSEQEWGLDLIYSFRFPWLPKYVFCTPCYIYI